jgi:hypothetical protein
VCDHKSGTGIPPATLAEWTMDGDGGDQDSFDVSVVDGFNLPMTVKPSASECEVATCPIDLVPNCPASLKAPGGCKSACVVDPNPGNSPSCCSGSYSLPQTCPKSGVPFYSYFSTYKRASAFECADGVSEQCKDAYVFAYDDNTGGLKHCESHFKSDYTVMCVILVWNLALSAIFLTCLSAQILPLSIAVICRSRLIEERVRCVILYDVYNHNASTSFSSVSDRSCVSNMMLGRQARRSKRLTAWKNMRRLVADMYMIRAGIVKLGWRYRCCIIFWSRLRTSLLLFPPTSAGHETTFPDSLLAYLSRLSLHRPVVSGLSIALTVPSSSLLSQTVGASPAQTMKTSRLTMRAPVHVGFKELEPHC